MNCPNCTNPMKQYNKTGSYVCGHCGEHAERPSEPFRLSDAQIDRLAALYPNDPRVHTILARREREHRSADA